MLSPSSQKHKDLMRRKKPSSCQPISIKLGMNSLWDVKNSMQKKKIILDYLGPDRRKVDFYENSPRCARALQCRNRIHFLRRVSMVKLNVHANFHEISKIGTLFFRDGRLSHFFTKFRQNSHHTVTSLHSVIINFRFNEL